MHSWPSVRLSDASSRAESRPCWPRAHAGGILRRSGLRRRAVSRSRHHPKRASAREGLAGNEQKRSTRRMFDCCLHPQVCDHRERDWPARASMQPSLTLRQDPPQLKATHLPTTSQTRPAGLLRRSGRQCPRSPRLTRANAQATAGRDRRAEDRLRARALVLGTRAGQSVVVETRPG